MLIYYFMSSYLKNKNLRELYSIYKKNKILGY